MEVTPINFPELEAAWQASVQAALAAPSKTPAPATNPTPNNS